MGLVILVEQGDSYIASAESGLTAGAIFDSREDAKARRGLGLELLCRVSGFHGLMGFGARGLARSSSRLRVFA
jgi:hypothetical protein